MVEAVIFDVDGTLVDTVDFHAEAWQRAFAHFGKKVGFAEIRSQIGKGGDQLMPVFLSKEQLETQGKAIETYRKDLFQRDYMGRVRGFPGTRELFEAIRGRGKRIALASSAKGDELEAYKKAAGIDGLTDVETSSDDAERSKPHPDIFEAALEKLALAPKQAVVIGDTPYDAEAAGKAGLATIGVLCGGFTEQDIRKGGARRIYADPRDLLAKLDEWLD
jgi:HAD superfamily hydrolase (TIGR01509 family)